MKQRKKLNEPATVLPLAKGSGLIDPENGKPAYVSPQVSVVHVKLENCIAASASPGAGATPDVDGYGTGGANSDDVIIF